MLVWIRARRAAQRRKGEATRRAVEEIRTRRGVIPIGGHVLCLEAEETIVRVMYMTDHMPPDRAWFAVPASGGAIRELTFDDVAGLESTWR
jgi:hypothetical protein